MKKFYAILVVLALIMVSSVAMAEVTVSGSVDIRSLHQNNLTDFSDKALTGDSSNTTQSRFRVNIDGKHDNVKGRITFENDWEVWGTERNSTTGALLSNQPTGVEARPAQTGATNKFGIREGWIDFTIPGAGPAHVKVGHQFLQLGNGWFFRSMKYGSDAWLVGLPGKNTIAFVDVKVAENLVTNSDDIDAYVLLDNFKIDDTKTVGIYIARVADKRNNLFSDFGLGVAGTEANLDTIGLWFNGKLGPMNLQAEFDYQMGEAKGAGATPTTKFKGNQIVVQGNVPVAAAAINFTLARGTGDDVASTSPDVKSYLPILDSDPHYTVVYEYFAPTACGSGSARTGLKNTGFCNTTALNLGGSMAVTKWLTASLDLWYLKATEKLSDQRGGTTDELGTEVDLVLKFKLYDQLTWNWQIARMMPGKAYQGATTDADDMDAIQGILSYKF
jgi:predicted porin